MTYLCISYSLLNGYSVFGLFGIPNEFLLWTPLQDHSYEETFIEVWYMFCLCVFVCVCECVCVCVCVCLHKSQQFNERKCALLRKEDNNTHNYTNTKTSKQTKTKKRKCVSIEKKNNVKACYATAAATIISGAVLERLKNKAYVVYTFFIVLLCYSIIGHWVWHKQGWLNQLGFVDSSGSAVVHMVGCQNICFFFVIFTKRLANLFFFLLTFNQLTYKKTKHSNIHTNTNNILTQHRKYKI